MVCWRCINLLDSQGYVLSLWFTLVQISFGRRLSSRFLRFWTSECRVL